MTKADAQEPRDLDGFEVLVRQYIDEDYGQPQPPVKIQLKRGTFVLEDGGEEDEPVGEIIKMGMTKVRPDPEEEKGMWKEKKERLAKFFGEAVEDKAAVQFAPQPPNVKMLKLKKIFGEAVSTSHVGMDPEIKEYNRQYRDSLDEGIFEIVLFVF